MGNIGNYHGNLEAINKMLKDTTLPEKMRKDMERKKVILEKNKTVKK